jgi:hypothetical protein
LFILHQSSFSLFSFYYEDEGKLEIRQRVLAASRASLSGNDWSLPQFFGNVFDLVPLPVVRLIAVASVLCHEFVAAYFMTLSVFILHM